MHIQATDPAETALKSTEQAGGAASAMYASHVCPSRLKMSPQRHKSIPRAVYAQSVGQLRKAFPWPLQPLQEAVKAQQNAELPAASITDIPAQAQQDAARTRNIPPQGSSAAPVLQIPLIVKCLQVLPASVKKGEVLANVLKNQLSQYPPLAADQAKLKDGAAFASCLQTRAPSRALILALEKAAEKIEEVEDAKEKYEAMPWSGSGSFVEFRMSARLMSGSFDHKLQDVCDVISMAMNNLQHFL